VPVATERRSGVCVALTRAPALYGLVGVVMPDNKVDLYKAYLSDMGGYRRPLHNCQRFLPVCADRTSRNPCTD
jgi:hypothetical protein